MWTRFPAKVHCRLQVTWTMTMCCVQFQSCVCRCPGGKSGARSGVLIMGNVCCACTAGLTTVDHLILSFLCCLKVTHTVCLYFHDILTVTSYFPECRFVAVDMAGHGLSSHRPPGILYSFPYYVMDMRRVIDGMYF